MKCCHTFREFFPPSSHQLAIGPVTPTVLDCLVSSDISLHLFSLYSRQPLLGSSGVSTAADESSAASVLLGTQIVPSPPSAWVIRDYIQQDALFSQGKEPEGSGGGRAFLQRRPGEAFLWPPRDWPWQLRRCLLCTAHHTLALHSKHKRKEKLWRWIKCTGAVGSIPNADRLPNAVRQWRGRCQLFWVYLITRSVVLSE